MDIQTDKEMLTPLNVEKWGLLDYQVALDRQTELVASYLSGCEQDRLILVQHPPTITLGRRGTARDLHFSESFYQQQGICLQHVTRGGLATAHEPGQLVAYPVLKLKQKNVKLYASTFLDVVIRVLDDFGVQGYLKPGEPGVWVKGAKICSFGIGLKRWVSYHGIALNINNDLSTFKTIVPCGRPDEIVTSLNEQLGHVVDLDAVYRRFVAHFCTSFRYTPIVAQEF